MRKTDAGLTVGKKVGIGFGIALLTLMAVGAVSYRTIHGLVETANWVSQAHHVLEHLSDLRLQMDQIETGTRGYVLTLDDQYLEPYRHGVVAIHETLQELSTLVVDPVQRHSLEVIAALVDERLVIAHQVIEMRKSGSLDPAIRLVQTGRGKEITDEFNRRLVGMEVYEHELLRARQQAVRAQVQRTYYVLAVGIALCALVLTAAGIIIFRYMKDKEKAEQALQHSNEELRHSIDELERRTLEISSLSEMGDQLHSCQTVEEAHRLIAQCVPRILPGVRGALGIISNSRNLIEVAAAWGDPQLGEQVFPPEDCRALRRGRPNIVPGPESALNCRHLGGANVSSYCCLPLMAQGEAIGLLHLQADSLNAPWQSGPGQGLAGTVADQISLALANLRLREALHQQSVRDPLTGLFNRRYMEESLELELRRAERASRPLGVLMLDLDNFKSFNDAHGHEAGDRILKEFSSVLRAGVRSSDIACRYGGEEFTIILPEASLEVSRQRAEQLREDTARLNMQGQGPGLLSVSIGVAAFPDHGTDKDQVLQAADRALYRAKREGRDRVSVATK